MVLSVLFGKKYNKTQVDGSVGTIQLDAVLAEEHSYSSRITSYPVEDGTIISDHIVNDPDIVTVSGIVSDTPLSILFFSNRSITAFNRLIQIHKNREVVRLVTGIKVYEDMALVSLDVPRDLKSGQSLRFNLKFQKIVFDNSIRLNLNETTNFGGNQQNIPREIVASNENYPILQFDPTDSLKDQCSSGVDVGIQSLISIPSSALVRINSGISTILGLT